MEILVAIALGLVPSLLWLAFFLKEDVNPEPRRMIAKVFIFGALSALAALLVQLILKMPLESLPFNLPQLIDENLSVFLGFSVIEEVIKFLFVYIAVRKSAHFDEPVDAMIYMITGALGFATAENFFVVFSGGGGDVFSAIVLRFIGATLLHALSSAIVGHHWARGIRFGIERKMVIVGLVLASFSHTLFNYLIFKFNDMLIYPTVFLVLVGFFVIYDFEELKKMR